MLLGEVLKLLDYSTEESPIISTSDDVLNLRHIQAGLYKKDYLSWKVTKVKSRTKTAYRFAIEIEEV